MTDQQIPGQPAASQRPLPSTEDFGTAPLREEWPTGELPPRPAPAGPGPPSRGGWALGGLAVAAAITVIGAISSSGGAADVEFADAPVQVEQISDFAQVVDPESLGPITVEDVAVLPQAGQPVTVVIDSPDEDVADLVVSWSDDGNVTDVHLVEMDLPLAYTFPALESGGSLNVSAHRVWGPGSTESNGPTLECRVLVGETLAEYSLSRDMVDCSVTYDELRPADDP